MLEFNVCREKARAVAPEVVIMSLTRELTVQIKDEARKIQKLGQKFLHNYLFLAVGVVGGACADVEQTFVQVSQFEKKEKLLEMLTTGKMLVFVEN